MPEASYGTLMILSAWYLLPTLKSWHSLRLGLTRLLVMVNCTFQVILCFVVIILVVVVVLLGTVLII